MRRKGALPKRSNGPRRALRRKKVGARRSSGPKRAPRRRKLGARRRLVAILRPRPLETWPLPTRATWRSPRAQSTMYGTINPIRRAGGKWPIRRLEKGIPVCRTSFSLSKLTWLIVQRLRSVHLSAALVILVNDRIIVDDEILRRLQGWRHVASDVWARGAGRAPAGAQRGAQQGPPFLVLSPLGRGGRMRLLRMGGPPFLLLASLDLFAP